MWCGGLLWLVVSAVVYRCFHVLLGGLCGVVGYCGWWFQL